MLTVIDNSLTGVRFAELSIGATFKYSDYYYMVTDNIVASNYLNGRINAIRLDNGKFTYFDGDDIVTPFNCELIVL